MTNLNWDRVRDDKKLKGGSESDYYGETSISDHEGGLDATSLKRKKCTKNKKKRLALNSKSVEKNYISTEINDTSKKNTFKTPKSKFHYYYELMVTNRLPPDEEEQAMKAFKSWFRIIQKSGKTEALKTLLHVISGHIVNSNIFSNSNKQYIEKLLERLK